MNQAQTYNAMNTALSLPVMEHFLTIQGEGFHQGKSAYFIRLAGCDVGCSWCDVKESWHTEDHSMVPISSVVQAASSAATEICVITGGEPLMYDLTALTKALRLSGKKTHIETSGAYPLSGEWDWICVSPKRFKHPENDCIAAADELKVVIYHKNDLRFAEKYASQVSESCLLYLQPEWSVCEEIMPAIIEYIQNHPKWSLSLQLHKYIHIR